MSQRNKKIITWLIALLLAIVLSITLYQWVGFPPIEYLSITVFDNDYTLQHPEALYLNLLIPLTWVISTGSMVRWAATQHFLQLVARSAFFAALTIALAVPTTSEEETRLCISYLVDHSASTSKDWERTAHQWVETSIKSREDFPANIFIFAKSTHPVQLDAKGSPDWSETTLESDTDTDIAYALEQAANACPADSARRVVLLSDGNETRGDVLSSASRLRKRGIHVSTVPIKVPPEPEVFISDVVFPETIHVGEPFRIRVDIFSSTETTATLTVMQNGVREPSQNADLKPGTTTVALESEVPMPGERNYQFSLLPSGEDIFDINNTWASTLRVRGRPQVLYIEGNPGSRHYLQRAVDRRRNDLANFDLETRGPWSTPATLDEMKNYDVIILSDVSSRHISRRAMLNFERYVRSLGGGLILVGGENSFGPGGFTGTPLESISPVRFEMERGRSEPSLAMSLVIDRSGSMQGVKLEMAKDAAAAVVDLLGTQDFVSVIAFDSQPETIIPLQQVAARTRLRHALGRVAPGGGTDILPALEEAYLQLLEQPARMHHVILLTDGQAPWDGISALASSMRNDSISVSTVGVGSQADRSLLQMIAELGGGRFYATNNPGNVPRIFVQETARISRSAFVEEPVRAQPVARSAALRGINWAAAPYLLGYVKTQPKPQATVLLKSERGDPILAKWRLGLGQVVVYTSDIKNRWAVEWVRSSIYPQFWAQLIRDSMKATEQSPWTLSADLRHNKVLMTADAINDQGAFINNASITAVLRYPTEEPVTVQLSQVAPGKYEGAAPLTEYGTYEIEATVVTEVDTEAPPVTSFTRAFPEEYQTTGVQTGQLRRIAQAGNGEYQPTPQSIWSATGATRTIQYHHWHWPAILALTLLLIDTFLRRIRLFHAPARTWASVT